MTAQNKQEITRREMNTALTRTLVAGLLAGSTSQATARDAAPASCTGSPKPDSMNATPKYRIYPLRNGICSVAGNDAFEGGNETETYDYALYVFLILGGDKPMLVDAGLVNVEEMNRGAAKVLRRPIVQHEHETVQAQLRRFGLKPEDIGHVFITHLHFDHVDGLDAFTQAQIHIGRKEWELATANDCRGSWGHGRIMFMLRDQPEWNKRLNLVDDQQILPGVESFWVGGHTLGSTAYAVHTEHGTAVLTGDTVSLLANIKKDIPVGVRMSLEECKPGMKKIREKADIVIPSHDPGTSYRWPPVKPGTPKYTMKAIKVGQCEVTDNITFQDQFHSKEGTRTYFLYVWLIEGGDKPIVVETGPNPKYVEAFNQATAKYIPGGVKQLPQEDSIIALKRNGIDVADVSHVIVTHLHSDHYDYFDAFPNATLVVNETEFEEGLHGLNPDVLQAICSRHNGLNIVRDGEEILPGIRAYQLGCHTNGSQGILVQTHMGPVLLAGDVVYLYDNIEQNRPGRSPDPDRCLNALARIRSLADIILPAHDPLTLDRWPDGIIGGAPANR